MQFYEINIYQVIIFRLYTVYNKHKMIKIGNQIRANSQVLSIANARIILLPTVSGMIDSYAKKFRRNRDK